MLAERARRAFRVAVGRRGRRWTGQALIGADGGKSVVRAQYVNDPPRVTGHVVYRAVVEKADFPENLRWNAASLWAGPKCHLVHYPLRGGERIPPATGNGNPRRRVRPGAAGAW